MLETIETLEFKIQFMLNMVKIMLLVQGELCLCLSRSAPPSLLSALCNFSERVGSQRYVHSYLNTQVFNTWHCYDVMSFVYSQRLRYIWQTVPDLGFVFVALRNCGGRQIAHNMPISALCCFNVFKSALIWGILSLSGQCYKCQTCIYDLGIHYQTTFVLCLQIKRKLKMDLENAWKHNFYIWRWYIRVDCTCV